MLQSDPCHVKIAEPCQLQTNTVHIHLENSQKNQPVQHVKIKAK